MKTGKNVVSLEDYRVEEEGEEGGAFDILFLPSPGYFVTVGDRRIPMYTQSTMLAERGLSATECIYKDSEILNAFLRKIVDAPSERVWTYEDFVCALNENRFLIFRADALL